VDPLLDVADMLGHDRVRGVAVAAADGLEDLPVIAAVAEAVARAGRGVERRRDVGGQIGQGVH